MFKELLRLSFNGNGESRTGALRNGSAKRELSLMELGEESGERPERMPSCEVPAPPMTADFEQIYQIAAAKLPEVGYGILKLREMADSPHLAGMSAEAKRCALLMALEAAGADVEDLLQDAVLRQRALNDYGQKQEHQLREYEAAKTEQIRTIQAELDRVTGQYMALIQANLDEIARQQDHFQDWQKRKQQECQAMNEAAAFLVPQGAANCGGTLTAVLERASVARR